MGIKILRTPKVMTKCRRCKSPFAARAVGLCVDCLRSLTDRTEIAHLHDPDRQAYGLPRKPPATAGGRGCVLCANACRMAPGERGFCGLHYNKDGRLVHRAPKGSALAHMYRDPLPTNCCAAWFCAGSNERGYNLAVFFYGCNFDCLFCQNASHKEILQAPAIGEGDMVGAALDPDVRCVCYFGGSPEPQMAYALRVSERVVEESGNSKRICWEWNGGGNPKMVERAADLSRKSGGVIKFDLKARHPDVALALCGVDNARSFENFSRLAKAFPDGDTLTATTLLVPYYVDAEEVSAIARFIADINPAIPYSLLIFHPDFCMDDLPVTPKKQVDECYRAARRHLERVNIGNIHLLRYAE
jgi:pyruvate formate lyase activating enzyme